MDGDLDGLEVGLLVGRGEGAKLRDGINDGWDEGCPLLDGTADVEGRAEGCEEGWLDWLGSKLGTLDDCCEGCDRDMNSLRDDGVSWNDLWHMMWSLLMIINIQTNRQLTTKLGTPLEVGIELGCEDGWDDGTADGSVDSLGIKLGTLDDCCEGTVDGWPLFDGFKLGCEEGWDDGCEEGWLDSLGNKLCDGLDEDRDDGCPLLDGTVDVDGFSDGEVVGLVVVGLELGAFVGY